MILLFPCPRPRISFSSAPLLRTRVLAFIRYARHLLGGRISGIRRAHTHNACKPAGLREGREHQDQKDRKWCRQKRARTAEQPRPEDKPDEENCRREAKPPAH